MSAKVVMITDKKDVCYGMLGKVIGENSRDGRTIESYHIVITGYENCIKAGYADKFIREHNLDMLGFYRIVDVTRCKILTDDEIVAILKLPPDTSAEKKIEMLSSVGYILDEFCQIYPHVGYILDKENKIIQCSLSSLEVNSLDGRKTRLAIPVAEVDRNGKEIVKIPSYCDNYKKDIDDIYETAEEAYAALKNAANKLQPISMRL